MLLSKYPLVSIFRAGALVFLLSIQFCSFSFGQDEDINYEDQVLLDNIKSIKFHPVSLPLSPPIIPLGGNARLILTFDDLHKEGKNYIYSVVHCNADWTPSDLTDLDYMDSFTEDDIDEYNFSFNTLTPYTNYTIELPNENFRWSLSGNYLLKVYEDEDEKLLAFTRRFMVVDPIMNVAAKMTPTAIVSNRETHHEFDFEILHKNIKINNPQSEIEVVVRQNNRWDNAITGLKPAFVKKDRLIYNYQNKIIFPASKEFRFLDIRSFRYMREGIAEILEGDQFYEVYAAPDESRAFKPFLSDIDLDGNFIIESLDNNNPNLRGDYAEVMFTLTRNINHEEEDIYVIGGFSDWQLKDECRMQYNHLISSYVTKVMLKEGFYDYLYAYVPKDSETFNLSELEGDSYETRNRYSILVYYRPFGQRYDQLVSVHNFQSGF